jgi:hypothetical protein
MILSHRWYISLLLGVHEGCASSSTREALILLSEAINVEERFEVCFWSTEEEIKHTSHLDRSYSQRTLGLIMHACIILHNMIINDERDDDYDENYHSVTSVVAPPVNYEAPTSLTSILQREQHLTSGLMFSNLQSDLIDNVWNKFY